MKVFIDGARTALQPAQSDFSVASGEQQVDCDTATSMTIQWSGPAEAKQIKLRSEWINTNNVRDNNSTPASSGTTATASGTIYGLHMQCGPFGICNCPGGGHGNLHLFGAYVVDKVLTTPFHYE